MKTITAILPYCLMRFGCGGGDKAAGSYNMGTVSLLQKFLMRKTGSFNRIMSSLCCRTVPGGYGSVRIRDFIVGKIMRCSVPISHTASSVPVALKARLVL